MRFLTKIIALGLSLGATVAMADLEPYKDYEQSDAIWSVTTIHVQANMDDAYLEGLKKTWVATNEVAKKLGQIEDYHIFRSELPQSGDFNLMLVIKFRSLADTGPSKARYEAFMKEFSKQKIDEVTEFSQKNYPAMRQITGDYYFREITLKK